MRFRRVFAAALGVMIAGHAQAAESIGFLSDQSALAALFDASMTSALDDWDIAGGVVAVVVDGAVRFAKGYGYADVSAARGVDPERTVFRVGSIAKPVTGTAVMQLVERGVLDLDRNVNDYLAAFQIPETYADPITLRHLLTHTAGFEERIIADDPDWPRDEVRPLTVSLPATMPARVNPPGDVASYSNWGVALAGHIVEVASGQPFAAYVEDNIFGPLGMVRSTFREPLSDALAADASVGYWYEEGSFIAQDFEYLSDDAPAGSLSSTAADMARFMIAHLNGGALDDARILRADTAAQMHGWQFSAHPGLPGMAMSFGIADQRDRKILQHSGATFVFHANMLLLPDDGVGLFVAFNGPGAADKAVVTAFLDRFLPRPDAAPAVPPADFAVRADRYTGSYRNNRLAFSSLEKVMRFDELTVLDTGRGTLFLGDLLSDPGNADEGVELIEVAPDLFESADGSFRIGFSGGSPQGARNMFVAGAMPSYHRIAWYQTIHVLALAMGSAVLVFGAATVWLSASMVRRRRDDLPVTARVGQFALLGMCVANAVFASGFSIMMLTIDDYFRYPPGTSLMLALPVASLALTALAAGATALSVVRSDASVGHHLRAGAGIVLSALFFVVLAEWHMLGWVL